MKSGTYRLWILLTCAGFLCWGCGKKEDAAEKPPSPGTLITVAQEKSQRVRVMEKSVGWIESSTAPIVAAEVSARVVAISADVGGSVEAGQPLAQLDEEDLKISRDGATADVNRLQALADNQQRQVERYRQLSKQELVSHSQLEDAEAQATASSQQLSAARSQLAKIERDLQKTRILSPVTGRVEDRKISVGDFVRVGDPMFQITTVQRLRVRLPFPEEVTGRLHSGLRVILSTPATPGQVVHGRITEIRPAIGLNSRAVEVIVDINNPGQWKPGGSVNGTVILADRHSMTVPEQSVVRRPAGEVVFAVKDGKAIQQVVKTGATQDGFIEILSGISPGETVALDGAGFLTDNAPVKIMQRK